MEGGGAKGEERGRNGTILPRGEDVVLSTVLDR